MAQRAETIPIEVARWLRFLSYSKKNPVNLVR